MKLMRDQHLAAYPQVPLLLSSCPCSDQLYDTFASSCSIGRVWWRAFSEFQHLTRQQHSTRLMLKSKENCKQFWRRSGTPTTQPCDRCSASPHLDITQQQHAGQPMPARHISAWQAWDVYDRHEAARRTAYNSRPAKAAKLPVP